MGSLLNDLKNPVLHASGGELYLASLFTKSVAASHKLDMLLFNCLFFYAAFFNGPAINRMALAQWKHR